MSNPIFLTPYQAQKVLEGVIPANQPVRPNWLQSWFGDVNTHNADTINFDKEFAIKNTMGMYVSPEADTTPIQLGTFGHKEMGFVYSKESLNSPDYEEVNTRRLGQQFGQVDIRANVAADLRAKLELSEQRFENLFERKARDILFYGTHTAQSGKHPKVYYDFGRTKPANATAANTAYVAGYAPELDLTTLDGNGGAGKRAWDASGGTAAPTPYKDLVKIVNTARRRGNFSGSILMSGDAYELLEADIEANYKPAADMTTLVEVRLTRIVLPMVEKFQDLNYRRSLNLGSGVSVEIYTYDAVYNDRDTGTETKYVPDGYVVALPVARLGLKRYGKIMHVRADWQAMPRFLNTWEDPKSGKREWESHVSFVMGHRDIDSVVSWKVM
jgi:hypothetical protein